MQCVSSGRLLGDFPGWEIFHLKGSPAGPERLYASQYSALFGQLIQRPHDGGKTWEPVGNKFQYESLSIEPATQMAGVVMGNPRNKDFWAPVLSKNVPVQDRAHSCAFFNSPDEGHHLLLPLVKDGLELGQKALYTN